MAELLAPVGSKDKLKAAVYSGVDAVYLGLKKFNARNNAENFDIDDICKTIEFCHSFGVKVYITLNTLVTDIELKEIEKLLKTLSNMCVDAVIVQDLGVLDLIRQTQSDLSIHASTQMNVHSVQGANLLKSLGVSRVVLSREMTLDEIGKVCKTGIEVEVFVHGALCYCVSGQCLLSSVLGARSANRGVCAQPCRLPFSFSKPPKPDLSLKDLCAIDMIDKLKNVGVHSFKIEGRMKRPEYVAAATAAYRNVLDGKKPDINSLLGVFSRSGFTNGYIKDDRGRHMFGIRTKDDMAPEGLYAKIRENYRRPLNRFKVNAHITIKRGQRVKLKFKDCKNESVVFGEIPQKAKGLGIDKQTIKNKIAKLGTTPYYLNEFEITADDGLHVPLSSLNELRRMAISKLMMMRMESWKTTSPSKLNDNLTFGIQVKNGDSKTYGGKIKLRIECEKFDQIVFSENLQLISLDIDEIIKYESKLQPIIHKICVLMPQTMFNSEREIKSKLEKLTTMGVKHATVQNLGQLPLLNNFILHGGSSLNITNSKSANLLKRLGFMDFIVSVECLLKTIKRIRSNIPIGMLAAGRVPLMVSRNCPIDRDCIECSNKSALYDRKGKKFPVRCKDGIFKIFNANMLWMGDKQEELENLDFATIKFTIESTIEAKSLVEKFKQQVKFDGNYTRGLYYRGI